MPRWPVRVCFCNVELIQTACIPVESWESKDISYFLQTALELLSYLCILGR